MPHFYLGPFPYACLQAKHAKEQDCETIPPVAQPPYSLEDSLQHALAFYLSIYFLSFFASSVVDIWSLTVLQHLALSQEREKDRTLILNPL
jgi:hypothetical protein